MPDPKGIPSLSSYLESLGSAEHAEFAARATSRVAHEDAFSEMKAHVVGLYEGVEAEHSFVDESGAIFDCVPVEQQPSLRGSSEPVPTAPDLPPLESSAYAQPKGGVLDAGRKSIGCDRGLPMSAAGRVLAVNEEHTTMAWAGEPAPIGSAVDLEPMGMATTFNLHDRCWLQHPDGTLSELPIAARGRSS